MIAYNIKTDDNDKVEKIDLIVDGKIFKIDKTKLYFKDVVQALLNNDIDDIEQSIREIINDNFSEEFLLYKNNLSYERLYYNKDSIIYYDSYNKKFEFNSVKFANKVKRLVSNGVNVEYILKFCNKLSQNPSEESKNMLFDFIEHNDIAINTEGNFLGYKSVRRDLYDAHSGTILYEPNTVVKMDRNKVDVNPNNHCSSGLHVGSYKYASNFSEVMLLVEVNPRDVVSVPNDHNCEKLRCCELKVISILDNYDSQLEEVCYNSDLEKVKDEIKFENNNNSSISDYHTKSNVPLRDPKTGRFLPRKNS